MIFRHFRKTWVPAFVLALTLHLPVGAFQKPAPQKFSNQEFAFTVAYQGETPASFTRDFDAPYNLKGKLTTFLFMSEKKVPYMISHLSPATLGKEWKDLTTGEKQKLTGDFFNQLASQFLASLEKTNEKPPMKEAQFEKNEFPVKEYQVSFKSGRTAVFRFYLVNSVCYVVCVGYNTESKPEFEEAQRFLDSFEFTPKPSTELPELFEDPNKENLQKQGL